MTRSTPAIVRSAISLAVLAFAHACASAQNAPAASGEQTLPTVNINASADASQAGLPAEYPGGQVARGGRLGLLGNVDNMSAPFSSSSYTQTLMQDQQARGVADVLLNDPTVRVARGFGNFQELYVIRGFPVNSDDMAYNGLYGILPRQFVATELLERVEVLRGANSFVNGAAPGGSGIGGSINLVPKRAPNDALTQFSAGVDNHGQTYLATDLARRFGPDGSTGIHLNLARRNGDTGVDNEKRELNVASVGLDYRNRGLRLSADVGYQEFRLNQPRPSINLAAGVSVPGAPNASSNYAQPWTYSNERDTFGTVRGEYDFAPNVTAWFAAGARRGNEANSLANTTVINAAGDTSAYRFDNARKDSVRTVEVGARANLRTGSIGHVLSASASTYHLDSHNAYALSDFSGFASNLYAPTSVAAPAANFFTGGLLSDPLATQRTELSSIALADTLSFADDRVLLTLGARHQTIREKGYDYSTGAQNADYDKSATTPVVGLVFKPAQNLSLYANYSEGLTRGDVAALPAANVGQIFSPYRSKQREIGAKYDWGKVGMSVALFTTTKPMGVLDPATNLYDVSGEQRSRGAEFTVYGMPARGLRLLGGFTFLDAKQERTAGGANDGKDVIGVPNFQANLGADWDVPGASGLSLNARALYTSSQYADAANTQKVPSWARFDAGVRYVAGIGKQALTLRGTVENLANRSYWASAGGYPGYGYLVQGAPRTLMLSATMDF